MDTQEFNRQLRPRNKAYREIFGHIPCITDYGCTREEYLKALELAVENRREIEEYIPKYANPVDDDAEI